VIVMTEPTRPYTIEDLHGFPADGYRRELIQGSLHVNPAPNFRHQVALSRLSYALQRACPAGLTVLFAPFDVILGPDTLLQPDLLVVPTIELQQRESLALPQLVVEVLSPSTRHYDRSLKRVAYEEAGIPSYWIVDTDEPSITVIEDGDERTVTGPGRLMVERPFPVAIRPADLVLPARG
jgi:Uma2 family endonuclease